MEKHHSIAIPIVAVIFYVALFSSSVVLGETIEGHFANITVDNTMQVSGKITTPKLSIVNGSTTDYVTDSTATSYSDFVRRYEGTANNKNNGFKYYLSRQEVITKPGTEVNSGVNAAFITSAYSTNPGGAKTDLQTNQTALVANSSAMDSNSSVGVVAINAIAATNYTGNISQVVNPIQANIRLNRAGGFFGDPLKPYGIGISSVNVGAETASIGMAIDTSKANVGWIHGITISGVDNAGIVVSRNTITPDTGLWINAAETYGIYVGAKPLYNLNPGQIPAFDRFHNPTVGIALGQRSVKNGDSNKLRFFSTNNTSSEVAWDIYARSQESSGILVIEYNGTPKITIDDSGSIIIHGVQVLTTRKTGWTAPAGTATRTSFDTATATLPMLAERVKALIDDLLAHGLIGN